MYKVTDDDEGNSIILPDISFCTASLLCFHLLLFEDKWAARYMSCEKMFILPKSTLKNSFGKNTERFFKFLM